MCRTCYLTVLNVQKATENVDARTRALRYKVSSAHALFQARNEERSLDLTATHSASGGSTSSQKKSIAIERYKTMNTISTNSCQ